MKLPIKAVWIVLGLLVAATLWWRWRPSREGFQASSAATPSSTMTGSMAAATAALLTAPDGCKILMGVRDSIQTQKQRADADGNTYMSQMIGTSLASIEQQLTAANCNTAAVPPAASPPPA